MDINQIQERLAKAQDEWMAEEEFRPFEDFLADALLAAETRLEAERDAVLEEAAKEVEACLEIYAHSGGRKSQRLTKAGVCMGVAMRIRELKSKPITPPTEAPQERQ
jgi:hypothetical protein